MENTNQALLGVLGNLRVWEGQVEHLYRDSKGNATIGIGCLVSDAHQACALPFVVGDSGRRAQPDEIAAEFHRVMLLPIALPAADYQAGEGEPRLYLTEDAIVDLGLSRLRALLPGLARVFPGFYAFPEPAQECLIDLGWNAGLYAPKGLAGWTHLVRAVNAVPPDWTAAAPETHCATSREARNDWRRRQMETAARLVLLG
jgi:GH24 family phage-related lysozyme (muramidase)